MKKIILGFVLCAILFSVISVSADTTAGFSLVKANYTTTISGKVYTDNKTPVLTYGKVTYIPLTANVVDALNLATNTNGNNLTIRPKNLIVNIDNLSNDDILFDSNNDKFVCLDSDKNFNIDQVEYDTFIVTYLPENKQATFYFNKSEVMQLHNKYYFKLDKINKF